MVPSFPHALVPDLMHVAIWFDDPAKEHVCDEVEDDVVLMKDRRGRVIGFERLNYLTKKQQQAQENIPVEFQML